MCCTLFLYMDVSNAHVQKQYIVHYENHNELHNEKHIQKHYDLPV